MKFVRKKKKAANAAALSSTNDGEPGSDDLLMLGVVLVGVDSLVHVVGFAVELALVLLGEVAAVLGHIFLFIVLKALFAAFQALGFAGRELAAFYTLGDAGLLMRLATVHLIHARVAGIDLSGAGPGGVAGLGLSRGRSDKHQAAGCHDQERLQEFFVHVSANPRVAV